MMASSTTVLVAVDEDSFTKDALKYYLKNLYRPDHRLLLFHALEIGDHSSARDAYLSPTALADDHAEDLQKGKKVEKDYMEILKEHKLHQAPRFRMEGGRKAGHVIVQVANEEDATLIVMGSEGKGGIARAILGSTSDYVMHHSTCPVLVCKGE